MRAMQAPAAGPAARARSMKQTTLFGGRVPPGKKRRRVSTDSVGAVTAAAARSPSSGAGSGAAAASRTPAASSFVQCPICSKHILLVSSDDHVLQCLNSQSAVENEVAPDALEGPSAGTCTAATADSVERPHPSQEVAQQLEPSRVDRSSLTAEPEQPVAPVSSLSAPEPTVGAAAAPLAPTAGSSVFSAMMEAARERTEKQQFSLSTHGTDGTNWLLHWSWTPNGGSGTTPVDPACPQVWDGKFKSNPKKGPDAGRELTIQLSAATAAAGGDDGVGFVRALAGALGSEGRHTLSPSQLKSALQKNIRLSRPAEAVRCAASMVLSTSASSHTKATDPYLEGITQLVRRLIIIIFEDGLLHPYVLK